MKVFIVNVIVFLSVLDECLLNILWCLIVSSTMEAKLSSTSSVSTFVYGTRDFELLLSYIGMVMLRSNEK